MDITLYKYYNTQIKFVIKDILKDVKKLLYFRIIFFQKSDLNNNLRPIF